MSNPSTEDDRRARASIEGRVAFAVAAFLIACGLVGLIDRVGAPESIVVALGPIVTLSGLAVLGLLLQAMRISRFYAAGRATPAPYAALAWAGLAAGLALPFLPGERGALSSPALLVSVLAGLGGGMALAGAATGPLLRKSGAFSLSDLLGGRFAHPLAPLAAAALVALVSLLVALASFESAVRGLQGVLGLPRFACALLAGFVLLAMAAPGGLSGAVWGACGAAGVLLAGLLAPIGLLMIRGEPLPLPIIGDGEHWRAALAHIADWQGAPFAGASAPIALACALGAAALSPFLSPAIACPRAASARQAGAAACLWVAVLALAGAASLAFSALDLNGVLVGRRPDELPSFAYFASGNGLLAICGRMVESPAAALAACRALPGFSGALGPSEIWASGRFLLGAVPAVHGLSVAFTGLAAAGFAAASLALAAASVQAFATAIAHDAIFRVRDAAALTSRRLAGTRMFMIVLGGLVSILSVETFIDPQEMIGLALAVCACAIAPLLALSLWPRATGGDAMLALLASLAAAAAVLALSPATPASVAAASLTGFAASLATGVASSLRRSEAQAREGRMFLQGVLHGESDLMNADKGA
ncbi:MAG: symporter-like protein [Hyphomicrobiales bacterium]|nr:symporter-like protein [Hyphomicrobiales bacterium]